MVCVRGFVCVLCISSKTNGLFFDRHLHLRIHISGTHSYFTQFCLCLFLHYFSICGKTENLFTCSMFTVKLEDFLHKWKRRTKNEASNLKFYSRHLCFIRSGSNGRKIFLFPVHYSHLIHHSSAGHLFVRKLLIASEYVIWFEAFFGVNNIFVFISIYASNPQSNHSNYKVKAKWSTLCDIRYPCVLVIWKMRKGKIVVFFYIGVVGGFSMLAFWTNVFAGDIFSVYISKYFFLI